MEEKKYYLGIDGGGTKTSFVLIDEDENIISRNIAGPSAMDTVSLDVIKNTLNEGCKDIKYKVSGIYAGLGGIASKKQANIIKSLIRNLDICDENTKIDAGNDVNNALYGALDGQDGMIVIAGTGSVCFGKDNDRTYRAGGYCYQEGDAGSAYHLGYRALQHLARVLDKRLPKTEFARKLILATGCNNYEKLDAYFINSTRTSIASLAKTVMDCYEDRYAKRIINEAIKEMLLMIKTVYKHLKFERKEVLFSIIGSLGNSNPVYKKLLLDGIKSISSNIKYVEKIHEADLGSALIAKNL